MGFTNVAWDSRSTEQLARDLTDGPGPSSVGNAGAAWIRVANEMADISAEFDTLLERYRSVNDSAGAAAAVQRLEEFGRWLQSVSASAAANGQRAEEAAVANTVAVLAMPTVAEAVEARAAHDMMASLAAYNGALLTGSFAEFDQAATTDQASAAGVMQQYEEACAALAAPWDQPAPPEVANPTAHAGEHGGSGAGGAGGGVGGVGGGAALPPMPLSPWAAGGPKSSTDAKAPVRTGSAGAAGAAGVGGAPYAPMGALGRGGDGGSRDHDSVRPAETLDGGGEPGAGLSDGAPAWLPAAHQSDAPFLVSSVSWGPDTGALDQLAAQDDGGHAEEPGGTLEQLSDRWVSRPVIGVDKGLTL
jgi:hypothetical protein